MVKKIRKYKNNPLACAMLYLIYLKDGEESALNYADEVFGKTENWALLKKLNLEEKGGWEKDWLTNMYRDLNKVLRKYNAI